MSLCCSEATMAQIEIMVGFMERNGDLSEIQVENLKDELEYLHKWIELSDLLNDKGNGNSKTLNGWMKTWEDLKTKVKNQFQRTIRTRGRQPKPSEIDKRVIALMEKKVGEINRKRKLTESSGQEDDGEDVVNDVVVNAEVVNAEVVNAEVVNAEMGNAGMVNEEGVRDEENISSDDDNNDLMTDEEKKNGVKEGQNKNNEVIPVEKTRCLYTLSQASFMWAIKNALVPFNLAVRTADNAAGRNAAIAAAGASTSSAVCPLHESAKRNRQDCDDLVNLAERYLDFEKKRAVLQHGREMLRLKQDEKYFDVMGKLARTLELTGQCLSKAIDGFLNML